MKQTSRQQEDGIKRITLFVPTFFILSVICIFLGVICLDGMRNGIIEKQFTLSSILWSIFVAILCYISVVATISHKDVLMKAMLSIYVFLVVSLLICALLQKTGFFEVVDSPEGLQAYLEKTGMWMPIIYIALQFLQVVVLPIPSIVSTIAGVALFGAFWAMVYSLTGILLGSLLAFFIGRKFGYKAVSWMIGEDSLSKWQKKLKGKDNLFLTLAFILPIFPDDILCFVAGLSSMTMRYFLSVIFLSRVMGIFATCYSVDLIPFNTWWGILIWIAIILMVTLSFIFIYKNIEKIQEKLKKIRDKHKRRK